MGIGYLTNSSIDRQLKSVTLSPKAITNAADAEAWFRAVPSGANVMKLAHDWGSVLSMCEGHPCASTVCPLYWFIHPAMMST